MLDEVIEYLVTEGNKFFEKFDKQELYEGEEFRWVPNYENLYLVSNYGRIYSFYREKFLSAQEVGDGYLNVELWKDRVGIKFYVHRLVLFTFIGEPDNDEECRHLDGNSYNNCLDNLEWGTKLENQEDKIAHGTYGSGMNHSQCVLTDKEIEEIRALDKTGKYYQREIAEMFNISRPYVSQIVNFIYRTE